MYDINTLKLMFDYKNGTLETGVSRDEAREMIYAKIVELNGGKKEFIPYAPTNPFLFALIGEYVTRNVQTGLKGNEFFTNYVEQKNMAEGDAPEFIIKAKPNYRVSLVSRGNSGVRRQRIGQTSKITVTPYPHTIKLYEEMTNILAGRQDIVELSDEATKAITKEMLLDVYDTWGNITSVDLGGTDFYPVAGTYDEDKLFELIQKIEAASDSSVSLVTTIMGARKLNVAIQADKYKDDYYNTGYALNFNGINVFAAPQRLKDDKSFALANNKIYIIPTTMDRPIKQVVGGQTYIKESIMGETNADMSYDVQYISQWNNAIAVGQTFGIYEFTA